MIAVYWSSVTLSDKLPVCSTQVPISAH